MKKELNVIKFYQGQEVAFRINQETKESEVRIDEVAKFCGWTRIANSGNEIIRWVRVNEKLSSLGMPNVGHGDFIPEKIMYPLIGMADLKRNQKARKFMLWVGDVLVDIRKHGAYLTDKKIEEVLTDPDTIIKLATELKEERQKRKILEMEKIENMPKVLFANAIIATDTSISVGDMSKLLMQNGLEIGQQRLFEWFRDNGYVIKRNGGSRNVPTQYSMDLKLMELEESININENGQCYISKQTKITPKGQKYFIEKFLKNTNQEVC